MTRIIAGVAGGRRLQVPGKGTRPTSDRVRESLFSSLGHQLGSWTDLRILDLYAGSGALGLEALSRGAREAVLVERDHHAAQVCAMNVESTALNARVERAEVLRWVQSAKPSQFDVVFADPPYSLPEPSLIKVVEILARRGWIAPDGLVVVERAVAGANFSWPPEFEESSARRIGDTEVSIADLVRSR